MDYFILLVGDENHVETRLIANYMEIWSNLIGQIISKLINNAEYDIQRSVCFPLINRVLEF